MFPNPPQQDRSAEGQTSSSASFSWKKFPLFPRIWDFSKGNGSHDPPKPPDPEKNGNFFLLPYIPGSTCCPRSCRRLPKFGNPEFGDPGFGDPGFGNPGFGDPRFENPGFGDPEFGNPRFGNPRFGDPRFVEPRFVDLGFVDPGFRDPSSSGESSGISGSATRVPSRERFPRRRESTAAMAETLRTDGRTWASGRGQTDGHGNGNWGHRDRRTWAWELGNGDRQTQGQTDGHGNWATGTDRRTRVLGWGQMDGHGNGALRTQGQMDTGMVTGDRQTDIGMVTGDTGTDRRTRGWQRELALGAETPGYSRIWDPNPGISGRKILGYPKIWDPNPGIPGFQLQTRESQDVGPKSRNLRRRN